MSSRSISRCSEERGDGASSNDVHMYLSIMVLALSPVSCLSDQFRAPPRNVPLYTTQPGWDFHFTFSQPLPFNSFPPIHPNNACLACRDLGTVPRVTRFRTVSSIHSLFQKCRRRPLRDLDDRPCSSTQNRKGVSATALHQRSEQGRLQPGQLRGKCPVGPSALWTRESPPPVRHVLPCR